MTFYWLCTAGDVVCSWGRGEDGQLGHGDAEDRLIPTHLSALDGLEISSVTCGADHTTAYSERHMEVYSWGWFVLYFYSALMDLYYLVLVGSLNMWSHNLFFISFFLMFSINLNLTLKVWSFSF